MQKIVRDKLKTLIENRQDIPLSIEDYLNHIAAIVDVPSEQNEAFLNDIIFVLDYQNKPSTANQGQALDGYSALANYNSIAKKIKEYLKTVQKTDK